MQRRHATLGVTGALYITPMLHKTYPITCNVMHAHLYFMRAPYFMVTLLAALMITLYNLF